MRPLILVLSVVFLAGCSMPKMPSMPKLPRIGMPSMPKLPDWKVPFMGDGGDTPAAEIQAALPDGNPMETMAGLWEFSHVGFTSSTDPGVREAESYAAKQMAGSRFVIARDGEASKVVFGSPSRFRVEVKESTPVYIRLGDVGVSKGQELTYDRKDGVLIYPMDIDVDGDTATLPAYFKKVGA